MSEKKNEAKSDAAAAPVAPEKKGGMGKIIGVVGALMVVEAAAVYMFVVKTGPQPAAAHEIVGKDEPNLDATVELPLIEEKFQNMQTGRVWVWDTNIILKVKAKNSEFVTKQLEERAGEITEGVSMIFRRAQHSHLKEPGLETINRQVFTFINQLLGKDADEKLRVERVVIPKCKGFPAD